MGKYKWILVLIIGLGIIIRAFLVYSSTHISFGTDGPTYDSIAQNIAFKSIYSDSSENEKPKLTARYPPAYPLFLAFIYKIFGHNLKLVSYIHIILYILASMAIFKLGALLFDYKTAVWGVGFFSIEPVSIFYSVVPMPEIITAIFLPLTIYFLVKFLKDYQDNLKGYIYLVCSSIMLALAILSKPIFLFFPLVFLVFLGIYLRRALKKIFFIFTSSLIVIALVLSIWVIRNYRIYEKFCFDGSINFISNYSDYTNARPYLIFNKKSDLPSFIKDQTIRYVFGTGSILLYRTLFKDGDGLLKIYQQNKSDLLPKEYYLPEQKGPPPLSLVSGSTVNDYIKLYRYSWKFALLYTVSACILIITYSFSIMGLYFAWKNQKRKEAFLLCMTILYFAAIIPIAICGSRYRFPSIPFYSILAGYGLEKIKKVRGWLS